MDSLRPNGGGARGTTGASDDTNKLWGEVMERSISAPPPRDAFSAPIGGSADGGSEGGGVFGGSSDDILVGGGRSARVGASAAAVTAEPAWGRGGSRGAWQRNPSSPLSREADHAGGSSSLLRGLSAGIGIDLERPKSASAKSHYAGSGSGSSSGSSSLVFDSQGIGDVLRRPATTGLLGDDNHAMSSLGLHLPLAIQEIQEELGSTELGTSNGAPDTNLAATSVDALSQRVQNLSVSSRPQHGSLGAPSSSSLSANSAAAAAAYPSTQDGNGYTGAIDESAQSSAGGALYVAASPYTQQHGGVPPAYNYGLHNAEIHGNSQPAYVAGTYDHHHHHTSHPSHHIDRHYAAPPPPINMHALPHAVSHHSPLHSLNSHGVAPPPPAPTIYYAQGPQGQPQAVYVNSPQHPPPLEGHYGYATIQYHSSPILSHATASPRAPLAYAYQYGDDPHFMLSRDPTMTVVCAHGQATNVALTGTTRNSNAASADVRGRSGRNPKRATASHVNQRQTVRGSPSNGGKNNGPRGSPSNPFLDEFRSSRSNTWTISDIKGRVVDFCHDQNGSRFIQQRLEVAGSAEKEAIMEEILTDLPALCIDVFGNYVVQKLLEVGTPNMKADITQKALTGKMKPMSMQMYGCRVVQKALEVLDEELLPGLLKEFHGEVLACVHNQHGNHVMQKCVDILSSKARAAQSAGDIERMGLLQNELQFVVDDILASITPLSCHPYGCRVLQRILEHCLEPQKTAVLDALVGAHKTLLDDQYGNYVIQHVLHYGRESDRQSILEIVVHSGLLNLSRQKFASNVVEKILKYGTPGQRNAIVVAMLEKVRDDTMPDGDPAGTATAILMVRDAYANYVVQTALDVTADGKELQALLHILRANVAQLRNYTFAKHIVTKLGS